MGLGMSREEVINTAYSGGGHVFILGAGASIAATMRDPELSGKVLPSMDNYISVVGLEDIVQKVPSNLKAENFEELYSNLYQWDPNSDLVSAIENRTREYFADMKLPNKPTIYDLLVLSLRSKDLIATFNWDPFLFQAWNRCLKYGDSPHIAFLHGNVAIGYSKDSKQSGPAGMTTMEGHHYMEPTKLLFPIKEKNYNRDEYIFSQWDMTRDFLQDDSVKRLTIFGFGAPDTDKEAVDLLRTAWKEKGNREMEQVEIIDIAPRDEIRRKWDSFIHSHHYDYVGSFFDSIVAKYPRRGSERWFWSYLPQSPREAFAEANPIPQNFQTLDEMFDWFKPLIDAEEQAKIEDSDPQK